MEKEFYILFTLKEGRNKNGWEQVPPKYFILKQSFFELKQLSQRSSLQSKFHLQNQLHSILLDVYLPQLPHLIRSSSIVHLHCKLQCSQLIWQELQIQMKCNQLQGLAYFDLKYILYWQQINLPLLHQNHTHYQSAHKQRVLSNQQPS